MKKGLKELVLSSLIICTPLVYLFWGSTKSNQVHFSNDGPLGVLNSQSFQSIEYPGAPLVQDLNWLGVSGRSMAGVTGILWWFCSQNTGRYVCLVLVIALFLMIAYAFDFLSGAICFLLVVISAPLALQIGVSLGTYGITNKFGAWYDCLILGSLISLLLYCISFYKPIKK